MISGEQLKAVREARSMGQKDLAIAANVTQSLISMIESGQRPNPEYGTVLRIARALQVPLTALDPDLRPEDVSSPKSGLLTDDAPAVAQVAGAA